MWLAIAALQIYIGSVHFNQLQYSPLTLRRALPDGSSCILREARDKMWPTADLGRKLKFLTACQWMLIANAFASSFAHGDAHGLATIIFSLVGSKLWSIVVSMSTMTQQQQQDFLLRNLTPFINRRFKQAVDSGENPHTLLWDHWVTVFSDVCTVLYVSAAFHEVSRV